MMADAFLQLLPRIACDLRIDVDRRNLMRVGWPGAGVAMGWGVTD
jgi:hypothetical protein